MKSKSILVTVILNFFYLGLFAQIPLVYGFENTGSNCIPPPLPAKSQLSPIFLLPDPFVFNTPGKARSTQFADWECRRNEIRSQIENYEIGPKPPRPDSITALYVPGQNGGMLTVVIRKNGKVLNLTSHVNLPATGTGPFPVVIGIALANGAGPASGSVPTNVFTDRNIATIEFVHDQVTQYAAGAQVPHTADPYYQMYPNYTCPGNTGQYSAWVWGVSRLIDGLEIASKALTNPLPIDLSHIGITGCSYAGKMALYSGAFDERIALTIAQENGGGGAPSWRYNYTLPSGTVEDLDNTDYSWFAKDRLQQFKNDSVYYLPEDHHELMAMILPRALFETGNTDYTWLGNRANYVDAMATKQIYNTFGIGERFGFYIDGGHGHCTMPLNQIPAVSAYVDKYLLGKTNVITDTIMIRPQTTEFDTINYKKWYSQWGANIVLPIQIKTFNAERKGAGVLLTWLTVAEQNNKGFIIQSSSDGISWINGDFIPSKAVNGNSTTDLNYQYTTVNNLNTVSYYRIVQLDFDNKQKYSDARQIKGIVFTNKVMIYPNPSSTGEIKIVFADAGVKQIIVFDAAGRKVQQFNKVQHFLSVTQLKTGTYLIQISSDADGSKTTHKIMVN